MIRIFMELVDMSIVASWLILGVLLVRFLIRGIPKWAICVLWGCVGLRLVCPIWIESSVVAISKPTFFDRNLPADELGDISVEQVESNLEQVIDTPKLDSWEMFSAIWMVGAIVMIAYGLIMWVSLKQKLRICIKRKDGITIIENAFSPFVMGVIRPKIYLPYGMETKIEQQAILHERMHIRRHDHWWTVIAYGILGLHWYNPLVWVAYHCFLQDIEYACDEAVIKDMDISSRKEYCEALVWCSASNYKSVVSSVSFSEIKVKRRVETMLKYKAPSKIMLILATLSIMITFGAFFTEREQIAGEINSLMSWTEVTLTYGLLGKEVTLDTKEEALISDLFWDGTFFEMSQEELEQQETIYGGNLFQAIFVDDDITYKWVVTDSNIYYYKSVGDEIIVNKIYHADSKVVSELLKISEER